MPERKTVKNRVHLDVRHSDREAPWAERLAAVAALRDRLVSLGGSVRQELPEDSSAHFMLGIDDPEGNELCIA